MNLDFSSAFSLKNETALITGGGSGIGLAIAQAMVAAKARVVLVGRNEEALRKACRDLGESASYVVQDITILDQAEALIRRAAEAAGAPLSILVNNAGNHLKKPSVDVTPEEFQNVMHTHVFASHALARAILPGMLERGHGHILFTASMASYLGIPLVLPYTAAKCAYVGMVRALASEVSCQGVRVNAIAPGWIDSAMSRKALDADPKRKEKVIGRTPMGRLGDVEEVGWAAVYLCSPAASFITGAVLPVDGGASIGF